jgi:hypothetical protein
MGVSDIKCDLSLPREGIGKRVARHFGRKPSYRKKDRWGERYTLTALAPPGRYECFCYRLA